MRLSKFFLPLLKESPSDAHIASHKLMLRAGMIKQQTSGIYSWLPLGLMTLKNIEEHIRRSMNKHGMLEILMPCVQHSDLWIESGRYDAYGQEMLRIKDRHDNQMLFGPTNEEVVTDIFRTHIKSYKDLPKILYQIQWKFRDEIRPRFGLLRGREFLMKDAYSFDIDKPSAEESYKIAYESYFDAFKSMGLKVIPVRADNGPIGGDLSHEFQVPAENGESTIYYDERFEDNIDVDTARKLYAAAEEKNDHTIKDANIKIRKGIEVGHIFYFGTKYTIPMKALLNDKAGNLIPAEMGSYGIGVSRLVAAVIEANHDAHGIIWPEQIAPFKISLINLHAQDYKAIEFADNLYTELKEIGVSTLYDDTNERPGSKFSTHDLIGSPYQVILNKDKVLDNVVELKHRRTGATEFITKESLIRKFKKC